MIEVNPRGFASDNNAGIHPKILKAIESVNSGHTVAYGEDIYCMRATSKFIEFFGEDIVPFVVFNGSAANVLSLQALTQRHNAVICADTAHIHVDECGAAERFTCCKLLTVPTPDGKLRVDLIKRQMHGIGFQHHVQPKVISITQPTELGTLYTPDEIRSIVEFAHEQNMYVHVDGARLANAAVALNQPFRALTTDVGIDVLSLGGTKNGMMCGDAIIFFNSTLAEDFLYTRKQGLQLASKMRFIAAQFIAYLSDNLWADIARHSNAMAQILAKKVSQIPQVQITQKVEANCVLAIIPESIIEQLQREYFFYVWDEDRSEVRWMTSWDTTEEDIEKFVAALQRLIATVRT